jgi:cation diffusion facilitator CzcD-associated flavoprotein CzcO
MLGGADITKTVETVAVETWLVQFERALTQSDAVSLSRLFVPDSYWRDVLAFDWRIRTVSGADDILRELRASAELSHPVAFKIARDRTPPRRVARAGAETIEAIFQFETVQGRGSGIVRLDPQSGKELNKAIHRAWTLLTTLDEIKGHEEKPGRFRREGKTYSRDFRGPNWLDVRQATAAYKDRDPDVLVIGGGQAGLSAAACLGQLQLDTLIVDRGKRIGDNWRNRYHALVLHNQVNVNHLPYMRFPPNWPAYIPKDKIAGWFEAYAESLELNTWTATEFESATYDERRERWSVTLRRDGETRELHPHHIVMATGVSGIPSLPDIPTLPNFTGTVLHSSQYTSGDGWRGKRALIIGSGNSGHDIAQDLHASGAQVTLVQRSPTLVVNVEPSAQLPYALYDEGPSLEDCDLITMSVPIPLAKKSHVMLTEQAKKLDRKLLDALTDKGFKLDFGDDGTGWQFKYLTRGGGYYFNVGCSDLIVNGEIALAQFSEITEFAAEGARLRSGGVLPADLIVLATGYKGQDALLRKLFGDAVEKRVGQIWGLGEDHELRNMFTRTAQPGLWFIAGSFAQCRIYSKVMALQIKACELGLIPSTLPAVPESEQKVPAPMA